jgi:hypothetical protein
MFTCLSIAIAVVSKCDPVVSPRTKKRLRSPPREQPLSTSYHRADVYPSIIEW